MAMNWSASKKDLDTIEMIVDRAENMYQELNNIGINAATIMMDITAAHCNGCPLDLVGLFAADNRDFFHDIHGIMKHIDRRTGKLTDCFIPHYARRTVATTTIMPNSPLDLKPMEGNIQ
jgi:hypothetical protein